MFLVSLQTSRQSRGNSVQVKLPLSHWKLKSFVNGAWYFEGAKFSSQTTFVNARNVYLWVAKTHFPLLQLTPKDLYFFEKITFPWDTALKNVRCCPNLLQAVKHSRNPGFVTGSNFVVTYFLFKKVNKNLRGQINNVYV